MTLNKHKLAEQWQQDHGDHTECPICGCQCRDVFMGNDVSDGTSAMDRATLAADAILSAFPELRKQIVILGAHHVINDRSENAVENIRGFLTSTIIAAIG